MTSGETHGAICAPMDIPGSEKVATVKATMDISQV